PINMTGLQPGRMGFFARFQRYLMEFSEHANMDNKNLKAQIHFQELTSSAYLAAKFSLLLVVITALMPAGALALGTACVVLAGASRLIELRMSIRDPAFYILLACGLLFCALDLAAMPPAENTMHYFAAAAI